MNFKKTIALILAVLLVFVFSGCKKSPDTVSSEPEHSVGTESGKKKDYLNLLYSMSYTFNPYTVKTSINRQICKLIYEPLIKLDNNFNPIFCIASAASVEGKICTVTLNSYKFSDGSSITADDVVYSYNLAKSSETSYSAKLYEVERASVTNSNTVVFTLTKSDPYFINVLNFPIIKSGSEKIADSDSVLQPPIGSGRYKVSDDRQSLVLNENYHGTASSIKTVKLINAPDTESVTHYAQVGAADMYYNDISDGTILRMSGKKLEVNLNSLVYIGINQNYGVLGENALRQALSSGIDRSKICQNIYYNNAVAATGFFHPAWDAVKAVQNIQIEAKNEITVENLEKIGYNSLDSKGLRVNSSGIPLKLTLLVNSENRMRVMAAQLISSQLADYGISVTVIEKSYEQYITALNEGNFQLYLGEIKITENMDMSPLVIKGGVAAYGLPEVKETDESAEPQNTEAGDSTEEVLTAKTPGDVVGGFYAGENTIADIASVLQSDMPFVPICYRTGVLFYNDSIENVTGASESDIYFSIESYIYNN